MNHKRNRNRGPRNGENSAAQRRLRCAELKLHGMSVLELASYFGVTRQRVYQWLAEQAHLDEYGTLPTKRTNQPVITHLRELHNIARCGVAVVSQLPQQPKLQRFYVTGELTDRFAAMTCPECRKTVLATRELAEIRRELRRLALIQKG